MSSVQAKRLLDARKTPDDQQRTVKIEIYFGRPSRSPVTSVRKPQFQDAKIRNIFRNEGREWVKGKVGGRR